VPSSAVIFDKAGLRVATVGVGDQVLFKRITIARDLGSTIEIAYGLSSADRVIDSPPDGIVDGDHVNAKPDPAKTPNS
jgi:hypothetical protein